MVGVVTRRVIKCILDVSRIVVLWTRMERGSLVMLATTSNGAAAITTTTIRIDSVIRITGLVTIRSEVRGDNVAQEGAE